MCFIADKLHLWYFWGKSLIYERKFQILHLEREEGSESLKRQQWYVEVYAYGQEETEEFWQWFSESSSNATLL